MSFCMDATQRSNTAFNIKDRSIGMSTIAVVASMVVYMLSSRMILARAFVLPSGEGRHLYKTNLKRLWTYGNPRSVPNVLTLTTRRFALHQSKDGNVSRRKTNRKEKWRVNNNLRPEHSEKLAAAFDDLAREEGFDPSLSYLADHSTFEDPFSDECVDLDDESETTDQDDILLPATFDITDFEKMDEVGHESNDFDDDNLDCDTDDMDDMDARIAAAKQDVASGHVSVPKGLGHFAKGVTKLELERLGFQQEINPFGDDETPRKQQFKLVGDALTCRACGSAFQSQDPRRPGYLPVQKFDLQAKLGQIEELQKLKEKSETDEWSADDEVEFLIQTSGDVAGSDGSPQAIDDLAINDLAKQLGIDMAEIYSKKVICQRCHGLQHFGRVDESLRPGWTDEPMMSQENFRKLLQPISAKTAVVIALVDLFDFTGSVLKELDGIAGKNPVIVAANKVDLLPAKMGKHRVTSWVRRELEYLGVKSIANVGGAVSLISCKTGSGVHEMLARARRLAEEMDCDVYVVGAANAGKSTLINYLLGYEKDVQVGKIRAGNRNALRGALTTSPLPGTTLKFIKVDLGDGRNLYDTPGLLVPGTITQLLTPDELKIVVPKKQVEPITFRVASGKCVLVGGLARIDVVGDSKPFLLTFFVANDIKVHPTDASKADDFILNHAGGMLTPPLDPGPGRIEQIGEFDSHVVEIEGAGWKEAAADINLAGLGWVAVTGAGSATIRVSVPKGVQVSVRPPLMPFDIWEVAAGYTGARAIRKSTKSKTGKRRKGVGRQ